MWAQIINAVLGLFLMAAPGLFSLEQPASDNFHIFGPVITTFAVISWWEATRGVRLWNLAPGAWLVVSPIFLNYNSGLAAILAIGVGVGVATLSFVRGPRKNRFGGGWSAIFSSNPPHEREAFAGRQPDSASDMPSE